MQIDRRSVRLFDRQVADALQRHRRRVDVNVVLVLADLRRSARLHHVLHRHRIQYIARRQTLGLQQLRVDVQHDRTLFAAIDIRNHGARYRHKLRTNKVQTKIVEILLAQSFPRQAKLDNRHARRAEVDDLWRKNARRKTAQLKLRGRRDLRVGGIQARPRLQIKLNDHLARNRGRLDVLNVIHQHRQRLLVGRRQPSFELLRIQARILPCNRHHRNVNVGKNVGRRARDHHRRSNQNEDRQHDEGVRSAEGYFYDPHAMRPRALVRSDVGDCRI